MGTTPARDALPAAATDGAGAATDAALPAAEGGFSSIEDALAAIARGDLVIVVDDPGRENEGDFVMAAEAVTPEAVNFMVRRGRGLLCMPVTGECADRLGLRPMVAGATGPESTPFTISIDLRDPPGTGIAAADRAACIRHVLAPDASPSDFRAPGHVFPLRARPGGVLQRPGHTEAAVDLARLAGLEPAGVICEILNDDGTMARVDDLRVIARRHRLHLITIADLIAYRLEHEGTVRRVASAKIPTELGAFTAVGYESQSDGREHVALVYGDVEGERGVLTRVHSECLTGDVLGSIRCDCGAQLREAMRIVAREGRGIIVYIRGHEGRGIGLLHKLRAYTLQDGGADTVEANVLLGFPADARDYGVAAQIVHDLGVAGVRLLTNNPAKVAGLRSHGVAVLERIALDTTPTGENIRYLRTKRDKLEHHLALDGSGLA